jgi:hypothetical protein
MMIRWLFAGLPIALVQAQTAGRIHAQIQGGGSAQCELLSGDVPIATALARKGELTIGAPGAGEYSLRCDGTVVASGVRVFDNHTTELGTIDVASGGSRAAHNAAQSMEAPGIASLFPRELVSRLPMLAREPARLVGTVAGSGQNSRSATALNAVRPGYTVVTLDGVNITDQFDRNGVDSIADSPRIDQVGQMTVIAANAPSGFGFGASQVVLATPSGGRTYHGSLYWQNRNSRFGANNWFSNRDGLQRPFLNRNIFGGTLGGPAFKRRVQFYANYEGDITRQQTRVNRTILTDDARRGIYTYSDAAGVVRKVNVLQVAGLPADAAAQQLLRQIPTDGNNFLRGDSRPGLTRNTSGYSFNLGSGAHAQRLSSKVDWMLSERQSFFLSYYLQRGETGQPGLSADFSLEARSKFVNDADLFSFGWRWNPGTWSIVARAGRNAYSNLLAVTDPPPSYFLSLPLVNNPVNAQVPYGRYGTTWNVSVSASRAWGAHLLDFGYQSQRSTSDPFDEFGIRPTYAVQTGAGNAALPIGAFPGLPPTELIAANSLLALTAGFASTGVQSFNVAGRNSGFVPGAPNKGSFVWKIDSAFVQDRWRIHPRVSIDLGMRFELPSVVDHRDGRFFLPVIGGNPIAGLRSNFSLDFAGSGTPRQAYRPDRNNFAPQAGIAVRLDRTGNTVFRGAYGLNHVEDAAVPLMLTGLVNEGLRRTVVGATPGGRLGAPPAALPTPVFRAPISIEETGRLNAAQSVVFPDPGLRTPYIQQWFGGLEHRWKTVAFEACYVGNHATGLLRGINHNQVDLRSSGFLDDFERATQNGRLALASTGVYNAAYNPAIAGSRPLTVFSRMPNGGNLANVNVQNFLLTGQPAGLAQFYQVNRAAGPVSLFPNPNALQTWLLINNDHATYNALQLSLRTQGRGHFAAVNYTFSKALGNSSNLGTFSNRLEPFNDIRNPSLDRARSVLDQTHAFKLAGVLDLPFGQGRRLGSGGWHRFVGGWSVSGILLVQSGAPFSILSGRATITTATASSSVDLLAPPAALNSIVGFRQTGNGPLLIAPSAIGPDGRGVASDGQPFFAGQAFANPSFDRLASLQRRKFTAPASVIPIAAAGKTVRLTERHSVEIRVEALNFLNWTNWIAADQFVSSSQFGRITAAGDPRILQLNLHYRF